VSKAGEMEQVFCFSKTFVEFTVYPCEFHIKRNEKGKALLPFVVQRSGLLPMLSLCRVYIMEVIRKTYFQFLQKVLCLFNNQALCKTG